MSHIHWVARGTGIPKDRDEVNRREVSECDGWVCDLDMMGDPWKLSLIRKGVALVRGRSTLLWAGQRKPCVGRNKTFLKKIFFIFFQVTRTAPVQLGGCVIISEDWVDEANRLTAMGSTDGSVGVRSMSFFGEVTRVMIWCACEICTLPLFLHRPISQKYHGISIAYAVVEAIWTVQILLVSGMSVCIVLCLIPWTYSSTGTCLRSHALMKIFVTHKLRERLVAWLPYSSLLSFVVSMHLCLYTS